MSDFAIRFANPWLLLLIIPLIGVALLLHFRVRKRYRRTRNRIVSLVLHCVACLLCVCVLAGITVHYSVPNDENEIILLVDLSDSEEAAAIRRDDFVMAVLETGMYDGFSIGVVTFGFDQVYAVPLTDDVGSIYEAYAAAELPDGSGTDIAAALTFAAGLFENPATGKIVLISDGKETDESAATVVRSIAAQGISVDTACIIPSFAADDVQIMGVEYPDYHLNTDEEFTLSYTLYSNALNTAVITMYDNGEVVQTQTNEIGAGLQTYQLTHSFAEEGLHQLRFEVTAVQDGVAENNVYHSYYFLEKFDRVLIVERAAGESEALAALLRGEGAYEVDILNLSDPQISIPTEVRQLCEYDQVIMNNIANADMPEGFADLLYSYVNDYGGGMLTVGGRDEEGNVNAYDPLDMYGTTYQSMLPVEAINYTPPIAVMLIVDASGSMGEAIDGFDGSRLDWARSGAYSCLDALTERDYIGVLALNSGYDFILPLTQRTRDTEIREAIATLTETGGGTVFSEAINRAGTALNAIRDVAKRHIIIVTDGGIGGGDVELALENITTLNANNGITTSIVILGAGGNAMAGTMQELVDAGHGRLYMVSEPSSFILQMREELNVPAIREVNEYPDGFYPTAYAADSVLFDGVTLLEGSMTATLGGFYGGRVRSSQYLVLTGEYDVPLYACWKFGAGSVGSFMCDLTGSGWSERFMNSADGQRFLLNMVNGLMPVTSIRPDEFEVEMETGNFINRLSIFADLEAGQYIRGSLASADGGKVISLNTGEGGDDENYVTLALGPASNYSRCTFVLQRGGVYELTLEVCAEDGTVVSSWHRYLDFSWSLEYDSSTEQTTAELRSFLEQLALNGSGEVVLDLQNPVSIFEDFVTAIELTYDPRPAFVIAAMILFLLDVAVRKFKFKWIHELIRERRLRK